MRAPKVFISYSHQDEQYRAELQKHLVILQRRGLIETWTDREINPGQEWNRVIHENLAQSHIILLLVSIDFLASQYCHEQEVQKAMQQHDSGTSTVIPVILRHCDWRDAPFGKLQGLPREGKPIKDWQDIDEAFVSIVQELKKVLETRTDGAARNILAAQPLPPNVFHALPPAPRFIGRKTELDALDAFWTNETQRVISLEAIGGAGKTAIAESFLKKIISANHPDGIFVWSFYDDRDPNQFFQNLYEYLTGESRKDVKASSWIHLLRQKISDGRKYFILLDGLERVQFERTNAYGAGNDTYGHYYGEIQDALLKEFLKRLCAYGGNSKTLITTRFPVSDLYNWGGSSYVSLNLNELDHDSAVELLRQHKIHGSNAQLLEIIRYYGSHALTIDHLGTVLNKFFEGNAANVEKIEKLQLRGQSSQARKLSSIFKAYESLLPEEEKNILYCICIFQLATDKNQIYSLYNKSFGLLGQLDFEEALANLLEYHLVLKDNARKYTVHPAVRDYFYNHFYNKKHLHRLVSDELLTLTQRPGTQPAPAGDPATTAAGTHMNAVVRTPRMIADQKVLNDLEELIYHLIQSGDRANAESIYFDRLGGVELGNTLGEFSRGYRILSHFLPSIIDYDGWLKFRRAIGQMPGYEELQDIFPNITHKFTHDKDSVLLLTGRLMEAAAKQVSTARFLIGEPVKMLFGTFESCPKFSAFCHANRFIRSIGNVWGNDAVELLWDADQKIKQGNYTGASKDINEAEKIIITSSSQEHLCILNITRSRLLLSTNQLHEMDATLFEAIHIARNSGFLVFLVDALILQAQLFSRQNKHEESFESAREAYHIASFSFCQYVWGGVDAAIAMCKAISNLNPDNFKYKRNYGHLLRENLKQKFSTIPTKLVDKFNFALRY